MNLQTEKKNDHFPFLIFIIAVVLWLWIFIHSHFSTFQNCAEFIDSFLFGAIVCLNSHFQIIPSQLVQTNAKIARIIIKWHFNSGRIDDDRCTLRIQRFFMYKVYCQHEQQKSVTANTNANRSSNKQRIFSLFSFLSSF